MDNISFGQYVPGFSWIYKLDPRLKIIASIALVGLLFFIHNIYGMLIALGLYIIMFLTTRIPPLKVLKGLKAILFLLLFTILLQLIYSTAGKEHLLYSFPMQLGLWQILIIVGLLISYHYLKKLIPFKTILLLIVIFLGFCVLWNNPFELFSWGFNLNFLSFNFEIYQEGAINAAFLFIRIVLMVGITSLLTLTTMTTDINNGLEAVLSPLKLVKIPVSVFSMLISLTLRFIPTLLGESKKIMNAQASRGVDFQEGSLIEKVNQIVSLLIPMFVISFQRAEDLANAMEARGYIIGGKRTKLDGLKLKALDYVVIFMIICLIGLVVWGNIYVSL